MEWREESFAINSSTFLSTSFKTSIALAEYCYRSSPAIPMGCGQLATCVSPFIGSAALRQATFVNLQHYFPVLRLFACGGTIALKPRLWRHTQHLQPK